jgi:hypothetical protein
VPANLILDRIGARRWMFTILVVWGLLSASHAFLQGPTSYYILRLLLGIAEAGFFPGMLLYMTYWFPHSWRSRFVGIFMAPFRPPTSSADRSRPPSCKWMASPACMAGNGCSSSKACPRPSSGSFRSSCCRTARRARRGSPTKRSASLPRASRATNTAATIARMSGRRCSICA